AVNFKAGSDVTATIHNQQGYYLDKSPLDAKDKQYTSTPGRTFIVAGCVPKNLPIKGPVGSVWVACNDLDYLKDTFSKAVSSPSWISSPTRGLRSLPQGGQQSNLGIVPVLLPRHSAGRRHGWDCSEI